MLTVSSIPVFFCQIGRVVDHPDAVTEILNNHDLLRAVIHSIREEKMAVAKQVTAVTRKRHYSHFTESTVCAVTF